VAMICARRSSFGGSLQNITSGAAVGCAYCTRNRAWALVTSSRSSTSTATTCASGCRSESAAVSHSGVTSSAVVGHPSSSIVTFLLRGGPTGEPAIDPGRAGGHRPEQERDRDAVQDHAQKTVGADVGERIG